MRFPHARIRLVRTANALPEITATDPVSLRACRQAESEAAKPYPQREMTQHDYLEELRRVEYERGMADGRGAAETALMLNHEAALAAERGKLEGVITELKEQFSDLYQSSEEAVVKFSFGIAERIIRKEVSLDRSIVLAQIRESVRRVLGVERLTIRVHPEDLKTVREQKSVIQANGDSIREIVVEPDEGLEPGDCVLESDLGNIDARVATQLKQIENVLFESKVVS
jgi:flagellar assembly protein FliH